MYRNFAWLLSVFRVLHEARCLSSSPVIVSNLAPGVQHHTSGRTENTWRSLESDVRSHASAIQTLLICSGARTRIKKFPADPLRIVASSQRYHQSLLQRKAKYYKTGVQWTVLGRMRALGSFQGCGVALRYILRYYTEFLPYISRNSYIRPHGCVRIIAEQSRELSAEAFNSFAIFLPSVRGCFNRYH